MCINTLMTIFMVAENFLVIVWCCKLCLAIGWADHDTPLLKSSQWLPIPFRIIPTFLIIVYKALCDSFLAYMVVFNSRCSALCVSILPLAALFKILFLTLICLGISCSFFKTHPYLIPVSSPTSQV